MKVAHSNRGVATLLAMAVVFAGLFSTGCKKRGDTPANNSAAGPSAAAAPANLPPPKKPDGKPFRLAFVTNNSSDFWKIAAAGVHKYEQDAGVQVDIRMPTDGKTPAEQNQILAALASEGYDAVAVSVIAPDDQVANLNRVAEKAKLITFDSDSAQSKRLLYVGTKNFEAGKTLGQEIVKLLPNGGKIAVFVGTFGADNAKQRLAGIEDAIKGKNIEIVEKREDQTDRAMARSNVETVLNARGDLNMVVGLWSYNGPAIAAALTGSGKKGKVKAAVFDEEEGTLDGIENDVIDVTCVQRPYEMGYQSSKWMHDLAARGDAAVTKIPADKAVDTGVQVINKSNVGKFREDLRKLTK